MVCAAARNHVESAIHAPTDGKGQGSYSCSDTDDCRCTVEKEG